MGGLAGSAIMSGLRERNRLFRETGNFSGPPALIQAEIPFLIGTGTGMSIELVDTPGGTDSAGSSLVGQANDVTATCDAMVLVFNYNALLTESEKNLITMLTKRRPDLFLRPGRTLFCTFTRMDQQDCRNQTLEQASQSIRDQLAEAARFKIDKRKVYVWGIKARQGLDARLVAAGRADTGVIADFNRAINGRQARKVTTPEAVQRFAVILEKDSGLPRLEMALARSLFAQAVEIRRENLDMRLGNLIHRSLRKTEAHQDGQRNAALRQLFQYALSKGGPARCEEWPPQNPQPAFPPKNG
jgi:hypothetical protein